jgi:hypothetical protein
MRIEIDLGSSRVYGDEMTMQRDSAAHARGNRQRAAAAGREVNGKWEEKTKKKGGERRSAAERAAE